MKEYWPVSLVALLVLARIVSLPHLTLQFYSNRCQEFFMPANFPLVGGTLIRESSNSAHEKAVVRKVRSENLLRGCFDAGIYHSPACGKLTCVELPLQRIIYLHMVEVSAVRIIPTRNDPFLKTWSLFFISVVSS
jgi:hypothetical protein